MKCQCDFECFLVCLQLQVSNKVGLEEENIEEEKSGKQ